MVRDRTAEALAEALSGGASVRAAAASCGVSYHRARMAQLALAGRVAVDAGPLHDATEHVFERIQKHAPVYTYPAMKRTRDGHLVVVDLVDVHFGKLCWASETGESYDLKIADRVYRDAVTDLMEKASGFRPDEFLLPIGSDFLHIDGLSNATSSGTALDADGRVGKIIETAELAVIWAVEEMARRGKVYVRWVPGNHDRLLSFCLARTVAAWFRRNKRVEVDTAPTARKYHRYKSTLIGMTHGDEERHSSLPVIMATERPADWAATTCREWHTGHFHRSKKTDHVHLDTHDGVPVRVLRSLSAVDAWHYRKGYVGSTRAAEAYLYGRDGLAGMFVANVRP